MKLIHCCLLIFFFVVNLNSTSLAVETKNVKLLAFSGSIRQDSYNKRALKILVAAAKKAGAEVTLIDLADYPLPLYNGDLEEKQGLPKNAKLLQNLIAEHDGLIIASPEYNGFPTPLLINVLDWTSRSVKDNPNSGLKIFESKPVALIAASPGEGGGARGLSMTSHLLKNFGLKIVSPQVAIKNSTKAFNEKGELNDTKEIEHVKQEAEAIVKHAR